MQEFQAPSLLQPHKKLASVEQASVNLLDDCFWGVVCSMHDLGFWGNSITFASATIFWIATITGVPNVLETESATYYGLWDGIYWSPQVRLPFAVSIYAQSPMTDARKCPKS